MAWAWEDWEALPWEPEEAPPKLAVLVDGKAVYGGLIVPPEEDLARHAERWNSPSDHQAWWAALWERLQASYPKASVEVYGVWAGNPAHRVRLFPKGRKAPSLGELEGLLEEFPEEPPF